MFEIIISLIVLYLIYNLNRYKKDNINELNKINNIENNLYSINEFINLTQYHDIYQYISKIVLINKKLDDFNPKKLYDKKQLYKNSGFYEGNDTEVIFKNIEKMDRFLFIYHIYMSAYIKVKLDKVYVNINILKWIADKVKIGDITNKEWNKLYEKEKNNILNLSLFRDNDLDINLFNTNLFNNIDEFKGILGDKWFNIDIIKDNLSLNKNNILMFDDYKYFKSFIKKL